MTPKKILSFAVGPLGAAAISIVTIPVIAWFFSAEDIGRFAMLQLTIGLAIGFFSLQMHQAYVREYHEVENKGLLFKETIIPGLCFLIIFFLIILVLPVSPAGLLFGLESGFLTVLLFVSLVLAVVINFQAHVVRMEERGFAYSITQIAPKILFLAFIGLVFNFKLEKNFIVLMVAQVLSLLLLFFVALALTLKTYKEALASKVSFSSVRRMLRFSLPLVAGGIAYWGVTSIDRLMLRKYSGFEELGIYSVALSVAASAAIFSSMFSNIWHPMVYKWIKNGVTPSKIISANSFILFVISYIWCGFALFSWVLLFFLPGDYSAVRYLVVGCVSAPLLYMLSETTVVGIGITRKSVFSMLASVAAFCAGLVANIVMTPVLGAKGAALSSMLSFLVFLVVRTESSCFLWYQLPRTKLYFVVLLLSVSTCLMILEEPNLLINSLVWLATLTIVTLLQFSTLKVVLKKMYEMMLLKKGWSSEL